VFVIPKAVRLEHVTDNAAAANFELSAAEIAAIEGHLNATAPRTADELSGERSGIATRTAKFSGACGLRRRPRTDPAVHRRAAPRSPTIETPRPRGSDPALTVPAASTSITCRSPNSHGFASGLYPMARNPEIVSAGSAQHGE
jgi:hypothetical protein